MVYSKLNGAYSLNTIDTILKFWTYWQKYYTDKGRTFDQQQIIDDISGDMMDSSFIPKSAVLEVINASSA